MQESVFLYTPKPVKAYGARDDFSSFQLNPIERPSSNPIEAGLFRGREIRLNTAEPLEIKICRQKIETLYRRILHAPWSGRKTHLQTIQAKQINEIKWIVWAFLQPYLRGEITKENEPKDRKPLVSLINEYFDMRYYVSREAMERIDQLAVHSYSLLAVDGFYKKFNIQFPIPHCVGPYQKESRQIYEALYEGMRVDFPGHAETLEDAESVGMDALIYVNKIRKTQFQSLEPFYLPKN